MTVQRSSSLMRRFARRTDGVAAVEFAAVLPVMVLMYLGMCEVTTGVAEDRKLTLLTRTLADLTAQASTMDDTEMGNVFNAAASVLAPYKTGNLGMVVSSVVIDANKKAKVCWSKAQGVGLSARGTGSAVALPSGLDVASTTLIMAETRLPYTPTIGYTITGTINLGETTYMRPRIVNQVPYTGLPTC